MAPVSFLLLCDFVEITKRRATCDLCLSAFVSFKPLEKSTLTLPVVSCVVLIHNS